MPINHSSLAWIKEIKSIGWDLDGTLYPSNPGLSVSIGEKLFEKIAEKYQCSLAEAQRLFFDKKNKLKSSTQSLEALGIDGSKFFYEVWDQLDLSEFIKPNPDLKEIFRKLNHYSHYILTNSNKQIHVEQKLACLDLSPSIFKGIITSGEIGFSKPNPKAFQALIKTIAQPPAQIIYVGDRVEIDIIPAKAEGLKTALIGAKHPEAHISASSPLRLADLLLAAV